MQRREHARLAAIRPRDPAVAAGRAAGGRTG